MSSPHIVPVPAPEVIPAMAGQDQKENAPHANGSAFVKNTDPTSPPSSDGIKREIVGSGIGSQTGHGKAAKESWIPKVRDISFALRGEGQPFPWAIEGLIVQRSANCVSGHPHAMKSFNMLAGCIELAHTQTLWGKFKAPAIKRTLFIETEDGEPLLESRIRGLLRGFGIKDVKELSNFHYARLGPFDLVKMEDQVIELIQHVKPDFVVLSTLQGLLAGRDWSHQHEMSAVNALLVRIGELLPGGLVVITHSPLDADARRPAGTVTQLANYSTAIHFTKLGSSENTRIDVRVDSKVGSEETRFQLDVVTEKSPEGNGGEIRQIKWAPKKGPTKGEVVKSVLREQGATAKTKDVVELVNARLTSGETVSPKYVNIIKKELTKEEKEQ
jgi:hypothetical protein